MQCMTMCYNEWAVIFQTFSNFSKSMGFLTCKNKGSLIVWVIFGVDTRLRNKVIGCVYTWGNLF